MTRADERCPCGAGPLHRPSGNSIPYSCLAYDINVPSDCQVCPYRDVGEEDLAEIAGEKEKDRLAPNPHREMWRLESCLHALGTAISGFGPEDNPYWERSGVRREGPWHDDPYHFDRLAVRYVLADSPCLLGLFSEAIAESTEDAA